MIYKCNHPGCNFQADTVKLYGKNPPDRFFEVFFDSDDKKFYCGSHINLCKDCNKWYSIDKLNNIRRIYYCNNCYRICPNCKKDTNKTNLLLQIDSDNPPYFNALKYGGCKDCAFKCNSCDKIFDADDKIPTMDNDYCRECYNNLFTHCSICGEAIETDEVVHHEGSAYCQYCFDDNFKQCKSCDKIIGKETVAEIGDKYYCDDCFKRLFSKYYPESDKNRFEELSYTKKDRYLSFLYKLLPISVRELKIRYPKLASALKELIIFAGGKVLTKEIVDSYRDSLDKEEFPIDYTIWGGIQRSIDSGEMDNFHETPMNRDINREIAKKPQLVLNILPSKEMLAKLKENSALFDLFNKINEISNRSGHPYINGQIGWARLELHPIHKYILVDEIQCDHHNAANQLRKGVGEEIIKIREALEEEYSLTSEQFNQILSKYYDILRDFPNIATRAISEFAKKHGYTKLYWHTYESGKNLKKNDPPKSLYDAVPKENLFMESKDKPFGLAGDFFEREAKKYENILKLARQFIDIVKSNVERRKNN